MLAAVAAVAAAEMAADAGGAAGAQSSTFRLNVSVSYGVRGVFMGCSVDVYEVLGGIRSGCYLCQKRLKVS